MRTQAPTRRDALPENVLEEIVVVLLKLVVSHGATWLAIHCRFVGRILLRGWDEMGVE
jgi:hypothetical protein